MFNYKNCDIVILAFVQDIKLRRYILNVCCVLFGKLYNGLDFRNNAVDFEKHSWAGRLKNR